MSTLADPNIRSRCCDRIARLDPKASPKWGRMTAPQMVCHLNDSFRVGAGEKYASPDTNLIKQTFIKWVAMHTSVPWPHGSPTRPEVDQALGGTPPADWEADCAELRAVIHSFAGRTTFAKHPFFGEMSRGDWLIWGYRHVDHHLRQFGQ
jgi:Protein of unknown function (DUF1569)